SVAEVTDDHNAALKLSTDGTLRAAIKDPAASTPHKAGYSNLLDRTNASAATLCGSCHDVVNTQGAHVERTFSEWKGTIFSKDPPTLTCGKGHMTGSDGLAAEAEGTVVRNVHAHDFPAVDVALTDFPEKEAQRTGVQSSLDTVLQAALCVRAPGFAGEAQI